MLRTALCSILSVLVLSGNPAQEEANSRLARLNHDLLHRFFLNSYDPATEAGQRARLHAIDVLSLRLTILAQQGLISDADAADIPLRLYRKWKESPSGARLVRSQLLQGELEVRIARCELQAGAAKDAAPARTGMMAPLSVWTLVEFYEEWYGKMPQSLQELKTSGLLTQIPVDKRGVSWENKYHCQRRDGGEGFCQLVSKPDSFRASVTFGTKKPASVTFPEVGTTEPAQP